MFSSISSYFFGAEEAAANPPAANEAPEQASASSGLFWTSTSSASTAPPPPKEAVDEEPVLLNPPSAAPATRSPRKVPAPSTSRGVGRGKKHQKQKPYVSYSAAVQANQAAKNPPVTEEDWVLVAPSAAAAATPLTLGSLNEVLPAPSPSTGGSTGSSASPSESGDDDDSPMELAASPAAAVSAADQQGQQQAVELSRSGRRLTSPFSCQNSVSLHQMKAMRSAQEAKQKRAGKSATAKAVAKKNKAVKNDGNSLKKQAFANRHQMSFKSAGCNKQLKQC